MSNITGILLAAGESTRFGKDDKLLQPLADKTPLALASLRNLNRAVEHVVVVVNPTNYKLIELLSSNNIEIVKCPQAKQGMAASIVCGVRASVEATGWIIALADMPFIHSPIIIEIRDRLLSHSAIARPSYQGKPGHPVGFGEMFREELMHLKGDIGARQLIQHHQSKVDYVAVDSDVIHHDIDYARDLTARN